MRIGTINVTWNKNPSRLLYTRYIAQAFNEQKKQPYIHYSLSFRANDEHKDLRKRKFHLLLGNYYIHFHTLNAHRRTTCSFSGFYNCKCAANCTANHNIYMPKKQGVFGETMRDRSSKTILITCYLQSGFCKLWMLSWINLLFECPRRLPKGLWPMNKVTWPMSLSFLENVVPHEHCHLRSPQCFSWVLRSERTENCFKLHRLHTYILGQWLLL